MSLMIPIPRTDVPRAPQAKPLAGSAHVWWSAVHAEGGVLPVESMAAQAVARLSDARPVLAELPSDRPLVMGIVNLTPDSFSDGGVAHGLAAGLAHALGLVAAGADILDMGGESTRPGAEDVPVADEIARTAPVIAALRAEGVTTPISIDTRKAAVAEAALRAGANMVNDVSAFEYDPALARVVAEAGVPVCLMHSKGPPQTMQQDPRYEDVLREVHDHLAARMDFALAQGVAQGQLICDPGIGFGKTLAHNLALLRGLSAFHALGVPLLLGASRKRFIGTLSGVDEARARMPGSLAVALHAAAQGAQILRVHDVAETVQALALWRALTTEGQAQ